MVTLCSILKWISSAPQVRNLTYMVTRREKMKRSLCRVQEQIFHHQVRLLDQELLDQELLTGQLLFIYISIYMNIYIDIYI